VIAAVYGVVKPSTEALAAVGLLIAIPVVTVRQLSYLTLALAAFWLGLVIWYWLADRRAQRRSLTEY
jgi:hypothetical protein